MSNQFIDFGKGKDGSPTSVSGVLNLYSPCTATQGQKSITTNLDVAPGDLVLLHQSQGTGKGKFELVYVVTVGSGEFTADRDLDNAYGTGAQAVKVPQYTTGNISGTIQGSAWDGQKGGIIAIHSNGELTISGSFSLQGQPGTASNQNGSKPAGGIGGGFRGGYGTKRNHDGPFSSQQGESEIGTGSESTGANDGGGGGGRISGNNNGARAGGGGGANANSGANGTVENSSTANPGTGGSGDNGNESLTEAVFGAGGGGGAYFNGTDSYYTYGGCSGGGFIFIVAKKLIVTGTVSVNGGTQSNPTNGRGMGGAGGGGSVLIKAQVANLGTNKITAKGGNQCQGESHIGGAGGDGRIHIDFLQSYEGETLPALTATQDFSLQDANAAILSTFL